MVKEKFLRWGLLFGTACMLSLVSVPAFGANYTPVSGTSCNFNKYLIMDKGDNVPNVTFNFTVAPGTAISTDTSSNDVMEVLAGVGSPTIAPVTFAQTDATRDAIATGNIDVARTAAQRQEGLTAANGVQFETGEKYATKQATVDFSSVSFTEPGIYRYIISETANADHANAGLMHDNDVDRVLDVYVTDDGDGNLVVSSYVMHTDAGNIPINTTMGPGEVDEAGDPVEDKTDGFTNEYNTKDLSFKKEVTGNTASRDKYFEFTVKVTGLNDADVFTVSLAADSDQYTNDGNAESTSGSTDATRASNRGKTNPTSLTGAQLKAASGVKFYLKHGQHIVIRGLPLNAQYTVTEDAEDYKSTGAAVAGYADATAGTMNSVTNKVVMTSYKNQREGVIPMGVAHMIGISMALILLVGIGGIALIALKRKRTAEE